MLCANFSPFSFHLCPFQRDVIILKYLAVLKDNQHAKYGITVTILSEDKHVFLIALLIYYKNPGILNS